MSRWRKAAVKALWELRIQQSDDPEEALQRIFDAYPFGPREHYPYKVWREECRRIYWWLYPKPKPKPLPDWLQPKGDR